MDKTPFSFVHHIYFFFRLSSFVFQTWNYSFCFLSFSIFLLYFFCNLQILYLWNIISYFPFLWVGNSSSCCKNNDTTLDCRLLRNNFCSYWKGKIVSITIGSLCLANRRPFVIRLIKTVLCCFFYRELIQFIYIIYITENKNNKILPNVHICSYTYWGYTLSSPNTKPKLGYANSRT